MRAIRLNLAAHSSYPSYALWLQARWGRTGFGPVQLLGPQLKRNGDGPASSWPCRRRQNLRTSQPVPNVSPVVSSSTARRQLRVAGRSVPTIDKQGTGCECRSSTVIRAVSRLERKVQRRTHPQSPRFSRDHVLPATGTRRASEPCRPFPSKAIRRVCTLLLRVVAKGYAR